MGAGALTRQEFITEEAFGYSVSQQFSDPNFHIVVNHRFDEEVKGPFISYVMAKYGVLTDDSDKRFVLEQAWNEYFTIVQEAVHQLPEKVNSIIDENVLIQRLVLAYLREFGHEIPEEDFLKLHFACFDQNKDGFVTVTEGLFEAFKTIFKIDPASGETPTEWLARKTNNKSRMNFDEFALTAKSMLNMHTYLSQVNFKAVFDSLDKNHDGLLSQKEIRSFMSSISNEILVQYVIPEHAGFDTYDLEQILLDRSVMYNSKGTTFKEFAELLAQRLPSVLPSEEDPTEEVLVE